VGIVEAHVDKLGALALDLGDRGADVVGLEGDVVEALAVALEEAGKEAVPERLEQLDLSPPGYSPPRASRYSGTAALIECTATVTWSSSSRGTGRTLCESRFL
jgi:hypothetical protein